VRRWVAIAALGSALLAPSAAQALDYAPVDQPGPALSVPQDKLDSSLTCAGNPAGGSQEPVLLVPGTTLEPPAELLVELGAGPGQARHPVVRG
jgi:hypothetical protein